MTTPYLYLTQSLRSQEEVAVEMSRRLGYRISRQAVASVERRALGKIKKALEYSMEPVRKHSRKVWIPSSMSAEGHDSTNGHYLQLTVPVRDLQIALNAHKYSGA